MNPSPYVSQSYATLIRALAGNTIKSILVVPKHKKMLWFI
jgi:hypothetical protein